VGGRGSTRWGYRGDYVPRPGIEEAFELRASRLLRSLHPHSGRCLTGQVDSAGLGPLEVKVDGSSWPITAFLCFSKRLRAAGLSLPEDTSIGCCRHSRPMVANGGGSYALPVAAVAGRCTTSVICGVSWLGLAVDASAWSTLANGKERVSEPSVGFARSFAALVKLGVHSAYLGVDPRVCIERSSTTSVSRQRRPS
jgi:hypothetical protein